MQSPLCEICLRSDKTTPATQVHHIISPFDYNNDTDTYFWDYDNLLSICEQCHGNIHATHQESTLYNIYYDRKLDKVCGKSSTVSSDSNSTEAYTSTEK